MGSVVVARAAWEGQLLAQRRLAICVGRSRLLKIADTLRAKGRVEAPRPPLSGRQVTVLGQGEEREAFRD
jgi:hypothetical protein